MVITITLAKTLVLFLFAILIIPRLLFAASITLAWNASKENDLLGYKIYYGQTNGGPYSSVVNVGNPAPVDGRIQGTVPGLTCGETYYFVCVAINDANVESTYSGQISVTPVSEVPGTPVNLMIIE